MNKNAQNAANIPNNGGVDPNYVPNYNNYHQNYQPVNPGCKYKGKQMTDSHSDLQNYSYCDKTNARLSFDIFQ